jgi:hypothetical protein
LTGEEAHVAAPHGRLVGDEDGDRLAGAGDDDTFATLHVFEEVRELRLGLVDVHLAHGTKRS